MGFFAKVAQGVKDVEERKRLKAEIIPKIKVSTSAISQNFEILDCVFAIDVHEPGIFGAGYASQQKAFSGVVQRLKELCFELGGDAVINCQFDYRYLQTDGLFGSKPRVEVYAYGTVVGIVE